MDSNINTQASDISKRFHNTSAANFHHVLNSVPLAIYLFKQDEERACEYMNQTFIQMFGYTIEDVPNQRQWFQKAYPDKNYRAQIEKEWDAELQTAACDRSKLKSKDRMVTCKDGTQKNIRWGYVSVENRCYVYGLDVSDQKRALDEIEQGEQKLRLAQSTALLGSWEMSIISEELFWSDMVYELFGLDPETEVLTIERFFEMVHPDDCEFVKEAYENSMRPNGPLYDITHRIIRNDNGEIRYLHERCTHFRDAKGEIFKTLGTVQDVTNHRLTELKLEKNLIIFKDIVNAIPDMLWLKDAQGSYILCNREFEHLVNMKEKDITGKTDYDLFPKEKADAYHQDDLVAMDNQKTTTIEESADYLHEGYSKWIETTKTPIYDQTGGLIGVLGIGRDISRRKEALNESESKQEFLNQVLDQSPIPMFITSPTGTALRCNNAIRELWALSQSESISKYSLRNDQNFIVPEIREKLESALKVKQRVRYEIYWDPKKVQGINLGVTHFIWLDISVFPLLNAENEVTHLVVQMVDISLQKKAAEDLVHQQSRLEAEVLERTKELRQIINLMAGRENRMAELKQKIKGLEEQLENAGTASGKLSQKGSSNPEQNNQSFGGQT
ncbi:PAS domain S-box protein [Kiritimatiellaeota bacterium B1221]|nr:PAS domain S-box protein [Kiritimatiellaeota bacterium B1221]